MVASGTCESTRPGFFRSKRAPAPSKKSKVKKRGVTGRRKAGTSVSLLRSLSRSKSKTRPKREKAADTDPSLKTSQSVSVSVSKSARPSSRDQGPSKPTRRRRRPMKARHRDTAKSRCVDFQKPDRSFSMPESSRGSRKGRKKSARSVKFESQKSGDGSRKKRGKRARKSISAPIQKRRKSQTSQRLSSISGKGPSSSKKRSRTKKEAGSKSTQSRPKRKTKSKSGKKISFRVEEDKSPPPSPPSK